SGGRGEMGKRRAVGAQDHWVAKQVSLPFNTAADEVLNNQGLTQRHLESNGSGLVRQEPAALRRGRVAMLAAVNVRLLGLVGLLAIGIELLFGAVAGIGMPSPD